MNNNILNELTTGLLDGGYLDLEFLVNTIEEHKLKVDDILDNHEELF
jgi:hypothetical protein